MAFQKSTAAASTPTEWGFIRWATTKPDLVTPNIEFYDSSTEQTSYLVKPGEPHGINIVGKIIKAGVVARQGFNDRKKGPDEKNEWRLWMILDDGSGCHTGVAAPLISDTKVPDSRTMELLNAIVTHLQSEGGKDTPVSINLYRRKDKNDPKITYPASIVRLPSGFDQNGNPEFKDPKNFVRTEALPPRGTPVMVNGVHLESNGQKVYDYTNVLDWAGEKVAILEEIFPKQAADTDAEQASQSASPDADPDGDENVDLMDAADQAINEAPRERATGG